MKMLIHICCAPCAIYPLRVLREEGCEVSGLYYNPNIHPYQEYRRRLEALEVFAGQEGLAVQRDDAYPMESFFRLAAFREEERCRICYGLRLARTAAAALHGGFSAFTTTLLYSRYQKHDLIRQVAQEAAEHHGITFFYRDFREGWSEGVRISKTLGMYRQPYCGCIYSEKDRYLRHPATGPGR